MDQPGPARVVPIREPVQLLAERWRELSQRWAQQHAPTTSYGRLCRCAELEVSDVERSHIRKDIRRSRPDFFCTYAPEDLDLTFHAAKLERVLCAWAVYDIEIGYVQAMNLLGSTLLMLLEGDEEAAFWVLVTLLRQLPHEFYSRAPLQLLGFWVEVEVLVQLADRCASPLPCISPISNAVICCPTPPCQAAWPAWPAWRPAADHAAVAA